MKLGSDVAIFDIDVTLLGVGEEISESDVRVLDAFGMLFVLVVTLIDFVLPSVEFVKDDVDTVMILDGVGVYVGVKALLVEVWMETVFFCVDNGTVLEGFKLQLGPEYPAM